MTEKRMKIILAFLMLPILIAPLYSSVNANLFAGYYYYGSAGSPPSNGVCATIYTINPSVPTGKFVCQWPMVIFSYAYGYYCQVGYVKGSATGYALEYFYQIHNSSGYYTGYTNGSGPSAGSSHTYKISKTNSATEWTFYIDGNNVKTTPVFSAVDYQCFSETTSSSININNTHFTYLEYKQVNDWDLWNQHVGGADSPYWLTQTSNYEFYAWGGG